ncbi:hypothetical protein CRU99_11560 [Malaciobacter mytili]|uniref:hypothetical protein n=1 Tax=Malaciobacter mytili TaxID=603050 RepID=UPI00100BFA8F|nr:hypothetical protein [Malaciobacter mytili]RXI37918.1 hypothetical protein CRU99_11560 [Malaciobacter mytili]
MLIHAIKHNLISSEELKNNSTYHESEEAYKSFLSEYNKIKFSNYKCWIPNNSGLLRWERIGLHSDIEDRISFRNTGFLDEGDIFKPLEILETNLKIEDDIPTFINQFIDFFKAYPFHKARSIEDFKYYFNNFKENGFNTRARPLFYSNIKFEHKVENEYIGVKSGEGHKISNGRYKGSAILFYVTNKTYNNLIKKQFREKLSNIYSSINKTSEKSTVHQQYSHLHTELYDFLKNNEILYSFNLDFTIESKGRVDLSKLDFYVSPNIDGVEFESLQDTDGYKQYIQLIFSQIKKICHGDNHHHHKDDVILRVYDDTLSNNSIILDQFAAHLKGLEKIELNRKLIECREFVPSYSHEADGIVAYSKMYYENYCKGDFESKRYIRAIKQVKRSLDSTVNRFNDTESRKDTKSSHIFREIPFWLLTITIIINLFSKSSLKSHNIPIINLITIGIDYIFSYKFISTFIFIGVFYYIYLVLSQKSRKKQYCFLHILHSDSRPKDRYYARLFDKKGYSSYLLYFKNIMIILFLSFSIYIIDFLILP